MSSEILRIKKFHRYMKSCGIEEINQNKAAEIYAGFLSRIENLDELQLYMATGLYLRAVSE